jgi:hypothetical protein
MHQAKVQTKQQSYQCEGSYGMQTPAPDVGNRIHRLKIGIEGEIHPTHTQGASEFRDIQTDVVYSHGQRKGEIPTKEISQLDYGRDGFAD